MRIAIAGRSSGNLPLLLSRVEDAWICVSDFTMNLEWCDSRRQKNAQTQERHTLPYTLWPSGTVGLWTASLSHKKGSALVGVF